MASKLKPIILISCGSFNPPTIMHLRLFGKFIFPKIILTFFTKTNLDEGLKSYKDEIRQG